MRSSASPMQKADVARRGIAAAAQHRDRAEAAGIEPSPQREVGARHQRARAGDAGALQARADERRAPGDLVVEARAGARPRERTRRCAGCRRRRRPRAGRAHPTRWRATAADPWVVHLPLVAGIRGVHVLDRRERRLHHGRARGCRGRRRRRADRRGCRRRGCGAPKSAVCCGRRVGRPPAWRSTACAPRPRRRGCRPRSARCPRRAAPPAPPSCRRRRACAGPMSIATSPPDAHAAHMHRRQRLASRSPANVCAPRRRTRRRCRASTGRRAS